MFSNVLSFVLRTKKKLKNHGDITVLAQMKNVLYTLRSKDISFKDSKIDLLFVGNKV